MGFDFDKYPDEQSDGFDFDKYPDAEEQVSLKEGPSALTSGLRSFANAGAGGFLDELSGAGEAAGRALGIKGMGGEFSDLGLSEEGPTLDFDKLGEHYTQARDRKRNAMAEDSAINPGASTAGMLAGAVASPLNKILPPSASLAGKGALSGGIAGLGNSQADLTQGNFSDAALDTGKGALLGGAIGGGMQGLGTVAGRTGSAIKEGIEDLATAPMRSPGMANTGMLAKGVNAIGLAGDKVDDITSAIVNPVIQTGNQGANSMVSEVVKKGAYAIPFVGKAVAAGDAARMAPSIIQYGAGAGAKAFEKIVPHMGKFAPVLESASQRGALPATHFVLMQTQPEYRELLQQANALGDNHE